MTAPGLEGLLAAELAVLGIVPGDSEPGGVAFAASLMQLADALLRVRTANRITVRLGTFAARSFGELERHAARLPWADIIPPGTAVHFRITSKKSRLYHQDAIAERLERVALAAITGTRAVRAPSAAEVMEDDVTVVPAIQRIIVRAHRDEFTLSADAAGALLHFRGWRQAVAKAPLRETLAAGLLHASGWHGGAAGPTLPMLDPFCGSGTIAIEAALIARRMAPGRGRRFAAEAWPGFDQSVFGVVRERAAAEELPTASIQIGGCDRDAGAIAAATANAERAGVANDVQFTRATISQLPPDDGEGMIVTNPPYGTRIGERTALRDLYATLGRVMAEQRPRWQLVMLSADHMLDVAVGLPLQDILRTTNGGIPVRVVAIRS